MFALAVGSICLVIIALAAWTDAGWWTLAIASWAIHDRAGFMLSRREPQLAF